MPASNGDEMSLKEIARTLADFRHEVRGQFSMLVRADVYRAEQAALTQRIVQLEKDNEANESDRRATRKLVVGTLLACVGTVVAALILVALGH